MNALEPATIKHQSIVKKAYQAFFSPSQYELKSTDQAILERGTNYRVPFDGGELAVTAWGSAGPTGDATGAIFHELPMCKKFQELDGDAFVQAVLDGKHRS